jgi:hypothetical protein
VSWVDHRGGCGAVWDGKKASWMIFGIGKGEGGLGGGMMGLWDGIHVREAWREDEVAVRWCGGWIA